VAVAGVVGDDEVAVGVDCDVKVEVGVVAVVGVRDEEDAVEDDSDVVVVVGIVIAD